MKIDGGELAAADARREYHYARHARHDVVPGIPALVASPERSTALPKKPNYDFEKRRKELDRKKKKDAKREERLQRGRDENPDDQGEPAQQDSTDDLAGSADRY